MKYSKSILILASLFIFTSCYHTQVTTDKEPSSKIVEDAWADSFVYGLVPPNVVETADECPNGLSKVETKISFLNGLVGALTFSIYTPMTIKVTCAAGPGASLLDGGTDQQITLKKNASDKEKHEAFEKASLKSLDSGEAVYVAFD